MNIKNFNQFISENYTELEFVCYNSDYETSSNKDDLFKLYTKLKEVSNGDFLPYMQEFKDSDYDVENDHTEISLAVIIFNTG